MNNNSGISGFYWGGKRKKYLDKKHKEFQKTISSLKITDNIILNSLEEFIKPTYSKNMTQYSLLKIVLLMLVQ